MPCSVPVSFANADPESPAPAVQSGSTGTVTRTPNSHSSYSTRAHVPARSSIAATLPRSHGREISAAFRFCRRWCAANQFRIIAMLASAPPELRAICARSRLYAVRGSPTRHHFTAVRTNAEMRFLQVQRDLRFGRDAAPPISNTGK